MGLGITTLSASLLDIKPYFHLQLVPHMTKYHQFWRILLHPIMFANSSELLLGEILLYNLSIPIERSFGPRKFASFVLLSSVLSTVLALGSILLLNAFGLNSIPAGPYGIIFSIIWQYYRTVPSYYSFKLFNIEFSSRILHWVLAFQFALSTGSSSILAAITGLVAGYLYRTDTLLLPSIRHRRIARPLKSYRIPSSVHNLLSRLLSPVVGISTAPRRSQRVLPGQISDSARQAALDRSILSSMLQTRTAGGLTARRAAAQAALAQAGAVQNQAPQAAPAVTAATSARGGARARMGEWVSEMTGVSGTRAPTEEEIATLSSMFPNIARDTIVRTLQRNDHNTARAVEELLSES